MQRRDSSLSGSPSLSLAAENSLQRRHMPAAKAHACSEGTSLCHKSLCATSLRDTSQCAISQCRTSLCDTSPLNVRHVSVTYLNVTPLNVTERCASDAALRMREMQWHISLIHSATSLSYIRLPPLHLSHTQCCISLMRKRESVSLCHFSM